MIHSSRISVAAPPVAWSARVTAHALPYVVGGGFLCLAIAWFFALRPALEGARAISTSTFEGKRNVLIQRRMSTEKLTVVDHIFSSITRDERTKLEDILPDDAHTADLMVNIEELVRISGLTLLSIGIETPGENTGIPPVFIADAASRIPPGVQLINLHAQASGANYLTLKKFLVILEKNVRLLDMPIFTFESENDQLDLTMHAYVYRPFHAAQ